MNDLTRRAGAEAVGTAFLVAAVIGSGIAAQRLSPGDVGLQLLANSLITGAGLVALILALQPVSAAFNPVITLVERALGVLTTAQAGVLIAAQLVGGVLGAVAANLMFSLPPVTLAQHQRTGSGLWLGEVIATLGLVLVVFGAVRSGRSTSVAYAVGGYITAVYWFTSSTSFANPAVTLARTLSDTFAGIAAESTPAFIAVQLLGGVAGYALVRLLYPTAAGDTADTLARPLRPRRPAPPPEEHPMTSTPPDPPQSAEQSQLRRMLDRIVDRLAYADDDRFTYDVVAATFGDSHARLAESASVTVFLPGLAERLTRERLDALAQAEGKTAKPVPEVLFVCVRNAGRSQMAAALARHHAGTRLHIRTGGSDPGERIQPEVLHAMKEIGLSVEEEFPKPLTDEVLAAADVVITMGCGDTCPYVPGRRYEDWAIPDPDGASGEQVTAIRDELDRRVRVLLTSLLPDTHLDS